MALSADVRSAEIFARNAHNGQKDKAGADYILHPERVAARVETPAEKVVAWLHDVVEDTGVTLATIESFFGSDTAEAVDAVTHRENESWSDYLTRVKANKVATNVKLADLVDNSNLSRFEKVSGRDVVRAEKYIRAMRFLMDLDD